MNPWITVIGIGDDGLGGIAPAARAVVAGAELLVGGARHQAMAPDHRGRRLTWADGLARAFDEMENWRGRRIVVLASGDPMCHGIGTSLMRRFGPGNLMVLPHPGAFELACARMLWSRPDTDTLTIHARPLELVHAHIQPGARLLILAEDGESPAKVAGLLRDRGFGPSAVTVLEHLGGADERRIDATADTWEAARTADLNTVAVECRAGPDALILPPVPGLPDEVFESDGQLTKREVRAVTLSNLAPLPGAVLWDVGAGSGSVAIEWLRAAPRVRADALGRGAARAMAIEPDPNRCAMIARNASALGVPGLEVIDAKAPGAFATLSPPDVVFVGGGTSEPGLLEACHHHLPPGGRLVANAVTLEGQQALFAFHERHGGTLTRLAVSRAGGIGGHAAFRPMIEVVQLVADKGRGHFTKV